MGAAAVPALLLKGPVIVGWLYDPGEERGYGDVDLLVAPRTIARAERVLLDLGFRLKDPDREHEMVSGPHAQTWVRPGDNAIVDLHHTLPGDVPVKNAIWPVLWERSTTMPVAGVRAGVIDPPSRALLVTLHALHHGPAAPGPLEDLRRAITRLPAAVWREAVAVAAATVVLERLFAGLCLLPEGEALARRLRDSSGPALRRLDRTGLAEAAPAYRAASTSRERAALLWDLVFPAAEFVRWWAPWARRSRAALWLGYAYRALWLAAHLPRGASAAEAASR